MGLRSPLAITMNFWCEAQVSWRVIGEGTRKPGLNHGPHQGHYRNLDRGEISADLEMAITSDPLFEQAMVIGENRPFVAALVVLNPAEWANVKAEGQGRPQQLILLERIAKAAKGFPAYAVPRAV